MGPEHVMVAQSLNTLGEIFRAKANFSKAEALYRRSNAIYKKTLGPDHPDTSIPLNNLALLYLRLGNTAQAESLFEECLKIWERTLGPDHPNIAQLLINISAVNVIRGNYNKAEQLLERSLIIRKKSFGEEHQSVAEGMGTLGSLYKDLGQYGKAESLYKRSLEIFEKTLGPEHPLVALNLKFMGMLYTEMGDYSKAEQHYQRALTIQEKVLGSIHPEVAQTINNMGLLYYKIGDHAKAEQHYLKALEIAKSVFGLEHNDLATYLSNLALLYDRSREAEPLYKRSIQIYENTLGLEHPLLATTLNNLALHYSYFGEFSKAESLYKRTLAIQEKILGTEHPNVSDTLNNLALLYDGNEDFIKAEPIYRRALAIREKALGAEHPDTTKVLNNLVCLYAVKGRSDDALTLMEQAQAIDKKQIDQILGFASEAQQTHFLATREKNFFGYLCMIHQRFPDNPKAIRNALNIWLARKGILLEAQKRIQDVLAVGDNPQAQEIFAKLIEIRKELARLVLGVPGKEGPEAYQKRIVDLTSRKEILEGQLSRLSQTFAQQRKTRIATTSTVAAALPKGTVLIEMARIRDYDFKTGKWGASRYLAFVLSTEKGSDVTLVDLGDADNIDQKAAILKKSLGNSNILPDILAKQSNDLYRLIFTPLTSALGKSRQIFLSPDGSLNLIPFEVLRDDKGRYLIETHTLHYVSAGRDIAGYGMTKKKGQKALLLGDPDFDLAAKLTTGEKERSLTRSRQMQGISFSRLPGTKEEVEAIAAIMGPSASATYTGERATESVLMQRKSPRILHLATHGFFLSDQDWSSIMDEKSRGISITAREAPSGQKPVRIENPFLRAGLALAGANRSLAQEGVSEGILSAEKILGLNLQGTDLVVLSACETGVGDVKNGEGVYGLRRAFTQAGAKSLVMSLWEVPDKETKELMVSFYKNLQSGKMNRAEALRHAALKQRETVKSRYGSDNPYYWGAFVFLGEAE
jgi:CHAT domain-containing protein/Flp pilus assembly protein TadD